MTVSRDHPAYRLTLCALLLLTVAVLAIALGDWWGSYRYGAPGTGDFIEYWSAGRLLLRGENPYDTERLSLLQREQGVPVLPKNYLAAQVIVGNTPPATNLWWCAEYIRARPVIMWNPPWLLVWLFPLFLFPFTLLP